MWNFRQKTRRLKSVLDQGEIRWGQVYSSSIPLDYFPVSKIYGYFLGSYTIFHFVANILEICLYFVPRVSSKYVWVWSLWCNLLFPESTKKIAFYD